ncbi:restriction endonuclease subunit S [Yimella sp. NH-Cas1]|uniref:restriction endonuclease subunit S n=1 Tax=Yimella sp. NH-Cas1 TaxID=2917726 RepID=UPI001EFB20E1|nr:restriction endonuclease subunit S [Yimella sp. NH-Cas1]
MTWPIRMLGEVADTALGKMLDRGKPKGLPHVQYLRNVNVQWGRIDIDDLSTMELSDHDRERFGVLPGDLLVCEGGEIGRCAIWRGRDTYLAYQKALHRVRPSSELDAAYLRYLLEHHAHTGVLSRLATGSTIAHLPQQQLRRVPVPLPTPSVQRRIVEILEDHLSRLDAAADYASASRRRIDLLITRHVTEFLIDTGGDDVTIGALAASVKNGIFVSRPTSEPDGVPILRIGAVRALKLSVDDLRYSGRSGRDLAARDELLAAGDLVFTRYNGNPRYVGACAVVPEGLGQLTYPDKLIRVRLDDQRVLPQFAAYACTYGSGRAQIDSRLKTSAGQVGISGRELKSVSLRIPTLDQQHEVVQSVEDLIGATRRLDEQVSQAISRHHALKRAVLAAAFSGKLTGHHTDDERIEELAEAMA